MRTKVLAAIGLIPAVLAILSSAAPPPQADLERGFSDTVRPFVTQYCVGCHSGPQAMAQLDLSRFTNLATVVQDHRHWELVKTRLTAKEMPPKQANQPADEARQKVIDWIDAFMKNEARKNAGDPGVVLARRLSNAEYNYTIRDLTGQDIRPTREFPVDPANPAGFDNSGESLAMSPSLMNKYLEVARDVANHLVLKPDGIQFAPHLVLVETDRDKYCVAQIIDFYKRQNTDYSDFFRTAWQFKHRAALGKPRATLADFAAANGISAKYLDTIWKTLEGRKEEIGPLAKLQAMWRELPAPASNQPDLAKTGAGQMRDYVVQLRKKLEQRFPDLSVPGISRTAQPFLMARNRIYATTRRSYDRSVLQVEGEPQPVEKEAAPKRATTDNDDDEPTAAAPKRLGPDPDLHVPAGQRAHYEEAFARFCDVFPNAFLVSERGRYFPDNTRDKGRHLSAGIHNLMGYFRDDQPLYELILDAKGQKELDDLWKNLDFFASANIRTYVQFYLFETREAAKGPDGAASTPDDKEITSEARIKKVEESYLARARAANNEAAVKAIEEHFKSVNDSIRWVERAHIQAELVHLEGLLKFASRAYRRQLTEAERKDLLAYYRNLRDKDGLSHEDAMRDSMVSILMSPDFCYRIDLVEAGGSRAATGGAQNAFAAQPARTPARPAAAATMPGVYPLSDSALASRLSYFLWSSMPDDELLARAAAGDLHKPEVLAAQTRRMLRDSRALGLATEFGGNWLDFRRFEEHNAVDRERFPSFDNELREAMFQEPVRFIADVIQNNHSILDMLYGNYTFVNAVLAQHYGMTGVNPKPGEWVRVDDAVKYGRGGLLPMSAFLTKNAPGLRTSPVKRGYWVVKRVLGETIPPPPAMVPELPRDEAKLELPLRDMLAKHREDPSCAACHARFDSFGLAMEGYGPIGERRTKDLAGHPVDARATFPGGTEGNGIEGIRAYIREKRQNDFVGGLCRKMLVYALGRSLMLSDEPAIESMRARLAANGYRFNTLVESIVSSPQFLTKRGPDFPTEKGE